MRGGGAVFGWYRVGGMERVVLIGRMVWIMVLVMRIVCRELAGLSFLFNGVGWGR